MVYGTGGAGKTTLTLDLGCHLAAGEDWLGNDVPAKSNVLVIEAEGPRPPFRKKVKRKLHAWGSRTGDRLKILESPWSEFTFDDPVWRERLTAVIQEHELDVVILGPLTAIGMNEAGTLQETRAFGKLMNEVRVLSTRPVTFIVVHHENKAGSVSGTWENVGDTLLHVFGNTHGTTTVHVQKARWGRSMQGKQLKLAWTDDEGFAVAAEKNALMEMLEVFQDEKWRIVKEIMADSGLGQETVEGVLKEHADRFDGPITGDAAKDVGRRSNAHLYRAKNLAEMPL